MLRVLSYRGRTVCPSERKFTKNIPNVCARYGVKVP